MRAKIQMQHRMLGPFLLLIGDIQAIEELPFAEEESFDGAKEERLTETTRTGEEVEFPLLNHAIDQFGFVDI